MKQGSTHFLRFILLLIAAGTLAVCIFVLPSVWKGGSAEFPEAQRALLFILGGLYVTAVPFFITLWQALKLLGYIDRSMAFSEHSVHALRVMKWCWALIALMYVGGIPLLLPIAQSDDAPGLVLFGAVIACAPLAVTVLVAVLERLLTNALALKSENDLTV